MSELVLLIKPDELTKAVEKFQQNTPPVATGLTFKGFAICAAIDENRRPAAYLNPVYGKPDSTNGDGDIIIQNSETKACPYPPGYGS